MIQRATPLRWNSRWIESALGVAVFGGFVYMAYLTLTLGYFPQPFFLDTDDTWRDWFTTAEWAHTTGAYDIWRTLYPPLSFVFLKLTTLPGCYSGQSAGTRECDWLGAAVMHGVYILNCILTARVFLKIDRRTALPRSFAVAAGLPMLFGLERGNLVLLCFTCVLLGFGPLLRSARWRWFFVGMAVNLKVYLIAGVVMLLLRRRWLWFEGAILSILGIYLVTYAVMGEGTPLQIYANIASWTSASAPNAIMDIWYPNTYNALLYVFQESNAPIYMFLSSNQIQLAEFVMKGSTMFTQAIIVAAAFAAWFRPEVVPAHRLAFFGFALAMVTSEASLYTQPILFLFVFMERWAGWTRPLAIAACYILCIPGDILLDQGTSVVQYSFISQRYVMTEYGLAVGLLFRPLLLMLPAWFLGFHTIRSVWLDIRHQGWKDRWRFRADWPLLPGIARPIRKHITTTV